MKTLRKYLSVTGLNCQYLQNGCAIVAFDCLAIVSGISRNELYHLVDYRVSCVNGDAIFLQPVN